VAPGNSGLYAPSGISSGSSVMDSGQVLNRQI